MTSVSVVIATRNRPEGAARTVASILANDYRYFELVVVDQSDDGRTARALAPFAIDARFELRSDPRRGLSAARNVGCEATHGDWIFFTDDDCIADPAWISAFLEVVSGNDRIGMAFGSVNVPAYDRAIGMIPAYQAPELRIVAGIRGKASVEGIGACMALRRDVWKELGGFDEALGANAEFPSGEDTDMAVRTLLAGYSVAETSHAAVVHHGFRSWEQTPALIADYMRGLGAVQAKLLRLGGAASVGPVLTLAWRWVAGRPVVDLNHRPPRRQRLAAFIEGFQGGMRRRIDSHGRFAA